MTILNNSRTADISAVLDLSSTSTNRTSAPNKTEIKQLITVSTLWTFSILFLVYLCAATDDIRVDLLLVLAILIGIPIMIWTYLLSTARDPKNDNKTK